MTKNCKNCQAIKKENIELKEQVKNLTNGNYKKGIYTMEQLEKIIDNRNDTIEFWTQKDCENLERIKELETENKELKEQLEKA